MNRSQQMLRFTFIAVSVVFVFTTRAQDQVSPNVFSPVTVDPMKSTIVSNGINMVKQFESVPLNFKVSPVTSDYELEFFNQEIGGFSFLKGSSHNIRAAYKLVSGNEKNEVSVAFTEKIISAERMDKAAFNHIFSVKGRRHFLRNDKMSISSGLGADLIIFSREITEKTTTPDGSEMKKAGCNFGLDVIAEKSISSHKITGGVLIQESLANESSILDLGFAALWGMPIMKRFAVNADILYRRTILGMIKEYGYEGENPELVDKGYKKVDYSVAGIAQPHCLSTGLSGTFLITDLFALNAGYRTQFLIEDYSSHTMFIGGRFAF